MPVDISLPLNEVIVLADCVGSRFLASLCTEQLLYDFNPQSVHNCQPRSQSQSHQCNEPRPQSQHPRQQRNLILLSQRMRRHAPQRRLRLPIGPPKEKKTMSMGSMEARSGSGAVEKSGRRTRKCRTFCKIGMIYMIRRAQTTMRIINTAMRR